ncbi:MAG: HipA domain-containing protein [Propionibacteriaceae bacterium]|nr:HipA domain-containing protein [Propionibacteriaceae bacterium]
MGELSVHLYGFPLGVLTGSGARDFDLRIDEEIFSHFPVMSTVLSCSIPLQPVLTRGHAARRRNFFAELLPEGLAREQMARQAGLMMDDVIGLLRRYGRDVAGAVEVFDPSSPFEPPEPGLRALSDHDIHRVATSAADLPLGNDPISGRISLGGYQSKFTLTWDGARWCQPLGGYPSTHIVKPVSPVHPTMIYDEEYGARLARRIGLLDYEVAVVDFDGLDCLVVERYDRASAEQGVASGSAPTPDAVATRRGDDASPEEKGGASGDDISLFGDGAIPWRIHQEDMNQALGVGGIQKYQEHGGAMTLRRIAALLARLDAASLVRLLRQVTMAAAIGNLDMHGKNLSILHLPDGTARLAPVYDMVPMLHQSTDGKLALAINGVYSIHALTSADIVAEAESWGLAGAQDVVMETLRALAEAANDEESHAQAHRDLRPDIVRQIEQLSSR